jgi:hypothetical protein
VDLKLSALWENKRKRIQTFVNFFYFIIDSYDYKYNCCYQAGLTKIDGRYRIRVFLTGTFLLLDF